MSTGKCYDCGKAERLHGCVRCADCHGQWLTDYMSFTQPEKQDHWTLPEDEETKAGWGPFNFDWIMKPYREAVEWHDRVTSKGSTAQKMGITNERINAAWRDMLNEMHRTTPKAGLIKRIGWFAGFFVSKINRFFYEGPLK